MESQNNIQGRKSAVVNPSEASGSKCDRYLTHQFVCSHPNPIFRCWMRDGCQIDVCHLCVFDPQSPAHAYDLVDLTMHYEAISEDQKTTLVKLLGALGRRSGR